MKLVVVMCCFIISFAQANEKRFFGSVNTTLSFTETGEDDSSTVKNEYDLDTYGLGFGFEYQLQPQDSFYSFNVGLLYELERDVDQVAVVAPGGAGVSRDDLPSIQMTSVYGSFYLPVAENISFISGFAYYSPDVSTKGVFKNYDIDPGYGYTFGLDFKIEKEFFVQVLRRQVVLETEDADGYEGEIDLSNITLLVGKSF
ncbi:MAG: hypothetical protein CME64_08910 [Halobacteriovoraceae bacterium]|nr:hypothetical protein [Halobacteriovoraceae bacterium]